MMDRRGFELAAGLIVILIASITIFGIASALTYKILCSSESKLDSYSDAQRQALEKRLSTGAGVVVADASKSADLPSSICKTSQSLGADFLIGVRNDVAAGATFNARCDDSTNPIQLEDPSGTGVGPALSISCADVASVDTRSLAMGARDTIPVSITVPKDAEPGRYIITLDINDGVDSIRKVNLYLTLS